MKINRIYAFQVVPQRSATEQEVVVPDGGVLKVTASVQKIIGEAFKKITPANITSVDFTFATADRSHPIRDEILSLGFGSSTAPKSAASRLALRLSSKMDHRSKPGLLLITVEHREQKREVTLLMLPRETVVSFGSEKSEKDEYLLELLPNAFSTGSGFRKLARLEGHNNQSQFLSVEVLDLQLGSAHRSAADFWIREFLQARPRIDSKTGSKELVNGIHRACDDSKEDEFDGVFSGVFQLTSGKIKTTSLAKFSKELPERLRPAFFRSISLGEIRTAVFDVDPTVVREGVGKRVIVAKDGVVVYAPAETIGKSVRVDHDGDSRRVRYSGEIDRERIIGNRRGTKQTTVKGGRGARRKDEL